MIGQFCYGRVSVTASDWLNGCAVLFLSVGDVRIDYISSTACGRHSTGAAPATGSLVFFNAFPRLCECCGAEDTFWSFCGMVSDCPSGHNLLIRRVELCLCKTMEGATLVRR